jgi:predicted Rossmann fold nucleotide-binding protein DprA/Smf involved in DNA uptake
MEYKTAIVGSRRFNDYELMKKVLDPVKDKIGMIISGGAIGADTLAQRYAKENGIVIVIYYPNYSKYGKKAPLVRNVVIANMAEKMIAFAYKDSIGTRHVISKMKQLGKPVAIIELEGEDND